MIQSTGVGVKLIAYAKVLECIVCQLFYLNQYQSLWEMMVKRGNICTNDD